MPKVFNEEKQLAKENILDRKHDNSLTDVA